LVSNSDKVVEIYYLSIHSIVTLKNMFMYTSQVK